MKKLVLLTSLLVSSLDAFPQGTAFTYQGRLNDNGNAANGIYDLRFTIYDAGGGSNVVAGPARPRRGAGTPPSGRERKWSCGADSMALISWPRVDATIPPPTLGKP